MIKELEEVEGWSGGEVVWDFFFPVGWLFLIVDSEGRFLNSG